MAATIPPILISSEEVNCLIYSYLKDSGFNHSAFTLRSEGQLDQSPQFGKHIPRGELIDLLSKALLYLEVENHWDKVTFNTECQTPFNLLDRHVCSLAPKTQPKPPPPPPPPSSLKKSGPANGIAEAVKRKATTPAGDNDAARAEKRSKKDVEAEATAKAEADAEATKAKKELTRIAKEKPGSRKSGPGPVDDITDPDCSRMLVGHKTEVFVCAWNPVHIGLLASGSKDATVYLWNLPNPPAGGGFAPAHTDLPLKIDHFPNVEAADLTSLDWNLDGTLLAIGSYDAILRVCTPTGELHMQDVQHQGPIFSTRFSKSGKYLLTASLDGSACVFDVQNKRLLKSFKSHEDCCLDIDWIDDNTFASCGADKFIHILRLDKPAPVLSLKGHTDEVNQIKINPGKTRLASCSDDSTARIWNISSIFSTSTTEGVPGLDDPDDVVILEGHKHSVSSVAWAPVSPENGNELVATSSFDGTAKLWDSVTGECLITFQEHRRPVYALSFSPDGRWLATGSGDGWLHIYSVKARTKAWSWFAGPEKPGVFEIDWQQVGNVNRIAMALERREVGVIDVSRIAALNTPYTD